MRRRDSRFAKETLNSRKVVRIVAVCLVLGAAVLSPWPVRAQLPVDLHVHVTSLRDHEPPRIMDEYVVFSHRPGRYVRTVGIAFAHENYRTIHRFVRQVRRDQDTADRPEQDVFFFVWDRPREDMGIIEYRLIVDGLWIADPVNPSTRRDESGVRISQLTLPPTERRIEATPVVDRGAVTFVVDLPELGRNLATPRELDADRVDIRVAGTFNHWDPFAYRLSQRPFDSVVFETTLHLRPGRYYYHLIVNGERVTDPTNPNIAYGHDAQPVSVLVVE